MHKVSMLRFAKLTLSAVCWFGTFACVESIYGNTVKAEPAIKVDPRPERLEAFFHSFDCPQPHYAREYVSAADAYAIDYRLLPAISVVESTCGRHQTRNNRWGWDSGRRAFHSVREGVEFIALQLAVGRYYKDKTLDQKVHMYNPDPQYARIVKKLMRKIDDRAELSSPNVHTVTIFLNPKEVRP
jgi:hypothetical protein